MSSDSESVPLIIFKNVKIYNKDTADVLQYCVVNKMYL